MGTPEKRVKIIVIYFCEYTMQKMLTHSALLICVTGGVFKTCRIRFLVNRWMASLHALLKTFGHPLFRTASDGPVIATYGGCHANEITQYIIWLQTGIS